MADKTKFHVRLNGGPEQTIETQTGVYSLACIAAVAMFSDHLQCDVEIWEPDLVEGGYGPYHYRVRQRTGGSGFESVQLLPEPA